VIEVLFVVLSVVLAVSTIAWSVRLGRPCTHAEPRELVRRALVVIPAHPDARALQRAVERSLEADARVDVVVVAAATGRPPIVDAAGRRVSVLRQPPGSGPVDALRLGAACGLARHYDAVVELSVEHSRLAQRITSLLEALDNGAHVAIGSRYTPGGRVLECGRCRRLASRGANAVLRVCTRLPLRDVTSHIRAYRRVVVEHAVLHAEGRGQALGLDVLLRCRSAGFRLAEVPVTAAGSACARTTLTGSRDLVARVIRPRRGTAHDAGTGRVIDITDPVASTVT
jgi:dolichol-phosphate mannosyltransferase